MNLIDYYKNKFKYLSLKYRIIKIYNIESKRNILKF